MNSTPVTWMLWCCIGFYLAAGHLSAVQAAGQTNVWRVLSVAQSDESGVYLDQIVASDSGANVPHLRLAGSPSAGRVLTLARSQIMELLKQQPDIDFSGALTGADIVKVSRRMRKLEETELRELMSATLQKDVVRERGELELQFTRPWAPLTIPDDPVRLRISDLPLSGISGNFIARFEISAGNAVIGNWNMSVQARVWREIWVTKGGASRGQLVRDADLALERRDVLTIKEELAVLDPEDTRRELARNAPAGSPIYARMLRLRPVVHRGQIVEAFVEDGALQIGAKVEVLEDGVPGQFVRVRNVQSRREFKGKVKDEETVLVVL
jgi:flagella basal body P-ring formation protein FlgA